MNITDNKNALRLYECDSTIKLTQKSSNIITLCFLRYKSIFNSLTILTYRALKLIFHTSIFQKEQFFITVESLIDYIENKFFLIVFKNFSKL